MTMTSRRGGAVLGAVCAALLLAACDPSEAAEPARSSTAAGVETGRAASTTATSTRSKDRPADEQATAALTALGTLAVKGRAPKTGYSRELFGQRWSDDVDVEFGHNGCDTRNDVLRRDLSETAAKAGTRDCVVLSGTLADPYTGTTIGFTRGENTSSDVQIDHVVALSDAWQKGAQQLSSDERRNFANDPRNLQAVDGPTNQAKGDGDAATWLPPNRSYRCTYVARQIEVKAAYRLWVTAAEKAAMTRLLTACGGTAPEETSTSETSDSATSEPETSTPATTRTPVPRTRRTTTPPPTRPAPLVETPDPGGSVYYQNCSAARAAGAAPVRRGQPGYGSHLDRDGDGVACE